MNIRSIRWVGIATPQDDAMIGFCRDVLGMTVRFAEPTTTELVTTDGDAFQVMGPGDPYFAFFEQHASGPVPLFEVDDLAAARRDVEAAGIEIVGQPGHDREWEWLHLRAPDGHLYELAARRD